MLHDASTPPPDQLTPAQRMALRLIAKGSRHAEAASILGISESALKARLRSARDRLMVRTTQRPCSGRRNTTCCNRSDGPPPRLRRADRATPPLAFPPHRA